MVWLDPDGAVRREQPIPAPPGYQAAPKTVAWDPLREEVWVTTDLLPDAGSELPERHDAFVLATDRAAPEPVAPVGRWGGGAGEPEIQFVHFSEDGSNLANTPEPKPGTQTMPSGATCRRRGPRNGGFHSLMLPSSALGSIRPIRFPFNLEYQIVPSTGE